MRKVIGFIALCLIWGSTWAAIRVLVLDVPPLHAAAVRFLIAGVLALVLMLLRGERIPRGPEWRSIAILGVAIIAVPFGIIFWAERTVSSGTTALIYAAMPVFTAFLTPLLAGADVRKDVPRRAVQAMIIGLGGIAFLFTNALSVSRAQTVGILALLVAVGMSAAATIYAKGVLHGLAHTMSAAWQFLFAAVLLEVASLFFERGQQAVWSRQAIEAVLFLSVFGSVIAFTLYYWLLRRMEPYRLAIMQLLLPIVAVSEGALLLREALTWQMAVAFVIVLGSVVVVMRSSEMDEKPVSLRE